MDSKTKKMKGIYAVSLLWFCAFITVNGASVQSQLMPTGITRVYGYAWYTESNGDPEYIRRAKAELWEIGYVETRLAISETNDYGYYEFNIGITGTKDVYVRIYCESYVAYVTHGVYGYIYWDRTPVKTISEGSTVFMGNYYASSEKIYWQAMDYVTDEYIWLERQVGWVRS